MKLGLYTLIIESRFNKIPQLMFDFGYGNGYVLIPKGHPFYGKHYDEIDSTNEWKIYVHGGLTYSEYFNSDDFLEWIKDREFCGDVNLENYKDLNGYWIIGFDTNHYNDNKQNCSKEYVIGETEDLLEQCLDDSVDINIKKYKNMYLRKEKLLKVNNI